MRDRDRYEKMGSWKCKGKSEFHLILRGGGGGDVRDVVFSDDVLSDEEIILHRVRPEAALHSVQPEVMTVYQSDPLPPLTCVDIPGTSCTR